MNYPIPRFLPLDKMDVRAPKITDTQIVDALVEHFNIDRNTVILRLQKVNFLNLLTGKA